MGNFEPQIVTDQAQTVEAQLVAFFARNRDGLAWVETNIGRVFHEIPAKRQRQRVNWEAVKRLAEHPVPC